MKAGRWLYINTWQLAPVIYKCKQLQKAPPPPTKKKSVQGKVKSTGYIIYIVMYTRPVGTKISAT